MELRLVELRFVELRVSAAGDVLARPADAARVEEAVSRLDEADDLLARLISDARLDVAVRLEQIRDGLGACVLAASDLTGISARPATVADVLRRGVTEARVGLASVDRELTDTADR